MKNIDRSRLSPLSAGRLRRQLRLLFPYPVTFRRFIRALQRIPALLAIPDPPLFIVGCGRSGTTLLLSILSADPRLL